MNWNQIDLLMTASQSTDDEPYMGLRLLEEQWRLSIMTPEVREKALAVKRRFGRC